MTRDEALALVLEPIVIDYEMPLEGARINVLRRTEKVRLLLPFLTEEERKKANRWLVDNEHANLWEGL